MVKSYRSVVFVSARPRCDTVNPRLVQGVEKLRYPPLLRERDAMLVRPLSDGVPIFSESVVLMSTMNCGIRRPGPPPESFRFWDTLKFISKREMVFSSSAKTHKRPRHFLKS